MFNYKYIYIAKKFGRLLIKCISKLYTTLEPNSKVDVESREKNIESLMKTMVKEIMLNG